MKQICKIDDCSRVVKSDDDNDMCRRHFVRWRDLGDPMKTVGDKRRCVLPYCKRFNDSGKYCTTHKNGRAKLRTYGVPDGKLDATLEVFYSLKNCEACSEPFDVETNPICVDHDHATGLLRGAICRRCNILEGYTRGDPKILFSMYNYLKRNGKIWTVYGKKS